MLEPFGTEPNWQFLENQHYAESYNRSRQQSIALAEVSNQFLWWTLLDDSAQLVSKTY